MDIKRGLGWIWYIGDNTDKFERDKCGKWMYYFDNRDFAAQICEEAVKTGIVEEAKYADADTGVCCFYLNCDDIDAHKKVISYFLEKRLIKKTKAGKLHNISFKLNSQTRAGQYGEDFQGTIKLADFIDLDTGNWIK